MGMPGGSKKDPKKELEERIQKKMDEWSKKPEELQTYDFREQIVGFKVRDPIARFFIYKALKDKSTDDPDLQDHAKKLVEYGTEGTPENYEWNLEADNCSLIQKIYQYLWDEKYLSFCSVNNLVKSDTMNSCTKTFNHLVDKELIDKNENKGPIILSPNIWDLLKKKRQPWSIWKAISQYYQDLQLDTEKDIKKALKKHQDQKGTLGRELKGYEGLEDLLSVAYTIGNFIPVPAAFNNLRSSPIQDYWDLTLYCIYKWYLDNEQPSRGVVVRPKNDMLYLLLGNKAPLRCLDWLAAFGSWDSFVITNYMQDFVDKAGKKDVGLFGRPKEFWVGHFEQLERKAEGKEKANMFPKEKEEYRILFQNVAECIQKRSIRMVGALWSELQIKKLMKREETT